MQKIFSDTKTFVDAIPLEDPVEILAKYQQKKDEPDFSLEAFVQTNFFPPAKLSTGAIERKNGMVTSLNKHWKNLTIQSHSDERFTTLINLPYPFVVPGGRFREMFYWDSYFTIIGLLESGEINLTLGMLRNFAHLIAVYGYIPNGNRTYFLHRSQPPFFAEMLKAFANKKGMDSIMEFLPFLETEYLFWTKDKKNVSAENIAQDKSVWLNGNVLNRYTGTLQTPRAEAYNKEYNWAKNLDEADRLHFHQNMRAACESGWDFSSRWFANPHDRTTCQCESLIPPCLNSLLYGYELQLADMFTHKGDSTKANRYSELGKERREAVLKYCWDDAQNIFNDYQFYQQQHNAVISLATVYPLFFQLAEQHQADKIARVIEEKFLKEGGLVTTLINSGEQWDEPNGWAPLQWLAVIGLHRYGHTDLAKKIAFAWLSLNEKVFESEHKMMEKYNVLNPDLPGGGGNYENQDGFGWTNGVAIALTAWLTRIN
jgi:alpha,alpha-trehalase